MEKISLDEVQTTRRTHSARGFGKYEEFFIKNAEDILNLDEKSGIRVKTEEFKNGKDVGVTTVQYNLMRLFYAMQLPYITVTYTKDNITYIVIKKSGDTFDESLYGPSHRRGTEPIRERMKKWLEENLGVEETPSDESGSEETPSDESGSEETSGEEKTEDKGESGEPESEGTA